MDMAEPENDGSLAALAQSLRRLEAAVVSLEAIAETAAMPDQERFAAAEAEVVALRQLHDEARNRLDGALARLKATVGE